MKIYINREPVYSVWGGGNRLVTALVDTLKTQGHDVVFQLQNDIDVIFCIDPRPNNHNEDYLRLHDYASKYHIKIIQRIGDLGCHGKPELTQLVSQSMYQSDFIIFPSQWAHNKIEYTKNNYKVIRNRPAKLFYKYRKTEITPINLANKLKIIATSWSTNTKKGFNTFKRFDTTHNTDSISFTFVGRLPADISFINTKHIEPLYNEVLAKELSMHDIYLSASVEEAGANSVVEALAAGLPVIYHRAGGSIPEYVTAGASYTEELGLIMRIYDIYEEYEEYKKKVLEYTETIDETVSETIDVIKAL